MTSANTKKYEEENRTFNVEWKENYVFVVCENKPLCLIWHKLLGQNKGSNVKHLHETNHKNFSSKFPPKSEVRKSKLTELKAALASQQRFMKVFSKESDATIEVSFMSWNVARSTHPYSDCGFVKKNITNVVTVLDPNNKKLQRLIVQMPSSHQTKQRRISQVSADITVTMQSNLKSSLAFSIAFDNSTDIQDNLQLAIFVQYVSSDLTLKEVVGLGGNKRSKSWS